MLRLRDIMTRDVLTMSPDFSIRDAMEFLATKRVSGAPVMENGEVVGVVSSSDLMAFAASLPGAHRDRSEDQPEWTEEEDSGQCDTDDESGTYFTEMLADAGDDVDIRFRTAELLASSGLDEATVADVMTERVHSLPSITEVSIAADYMRDAQIHRILVMENGKLRGIVSASDIAGAVADHRVTNRTYVFNRQTLFDQRP